MEQNNRISRSRYIFASYIDILILFNIVGLLNSLSDLVPDGSVQTFVRLILVGVVVFVYWFKDSLFDGKTPGKRVVGIKVDRPSQFSSFDAFSLKRNLFGGIAFLLYLIAAVSFPRPLERMYFPLLYILVNIVVVLCLRDRKLGDFFSKSRVVDDPENNWWKGVSVSEKILYPTASLLVILYPLSFVFLTVSLYFISHNLYANQIVEYNFLLNLFFDVVIYSILFVCIRNVVKFELLKKLLYCTIFLVFLSQIITYIQALLNLK